MAGIDRVRRSLEESIDLSLLDIPVDVIVMVPDLAATTPAAKLRAEIIRLAADVGVSIRPEHKDLIAAASEKLGEVNSLTAYEIHLVQVSDLVVLIPDSAGSLCELGLFSSLETFCQKLLILVNKEFQDSDSYVANGPLTMANQYRAEIQYVDYTDVDSAWSPVKRRLELIRGRKSLSRMGRKT